MENLRLANLAFHWSPLENNLKNKDTICGVHPPIIKASSPRSGWKIGVPFEIIIVRVRFEIQFLAILQLRYKGKLNWFWNQEMIAIGHLQIWLPLNTKTTWGVFFFEGGGLLLGGKDCTDHAWISKIEDPSPCSLSWSSQRLRVPRR